MASRVPRYPAWKIEQGQVVDFKSKSRSLLIRGSLVRVQLRAPGKSKAYAENAWAFLFSGWEKGWEYFVHRWLFYLLRPQDCTPTKLIPERVAQACFTSHCTRTSQGENHRSAPPIERLWIRLYIGLLAGPGGSKIKQYQGDSPPYGALWISRITGPRDPAIR